MFKDARITGIIILVCFWIYISPAGADIWTVPDSYDVNINEGCIAEYTLTIGNDNAEDLNFTLRSREISREILKGLSGKVSSVAKVKETEDKIILEYRFSEPSISRGPEYDSVHMKGLEKYHQTGAPIIPVRPATILVPFGKEVVGTRVIASDKRELPGVYLLEPAQKPQPLNYTGPKSRTRPDAEIYSRTKEWPGIFHEASASQSKRGYELFTVNLFPVQYIPATGKLIYARVLRLEIELADAVTRMPFPTQKTKDRISRIVDNKGALGSYPSSAGFSEALGETSALLAGGPYEYVIITNQALEGSSGPWNFQALRDARISSGMTATIVTTEWIYANYAGTRPDGGSDNQTRIRNFLIDAYQTWGTEYVLLGGTNDIVPARKFWVEVYPGGTATTMPVDMYYGCVDPSGCTFDYDADGEYGERNDGVGGGEVDLYAEIYVGRAAVQNATELANFIQKTLAYDSTHDEYISNISMVGEYLGFGGVAEYAKPAMEQIRLGGTYDGYFTYGFENHTQPDFYDFDTSANLYDADGSWPKSELIGLMNEGVHLFNHLGHANYTYDMKLDTSDLGSLTNTDYFFAYSQGCDPGGFDTSNCFAEVITTIEHGAFAVVMNARSGWGTGYSTDGPSQRFARQFWDAALDEDMLELGRANQDSKEDNLWDINGDCIRWCYYELNLFGDPAQKLRFEEAARWITFEPQDGTIGPEESLDVNVVFDAMDLLPGTYEAEIIILSNDINSPAIIPVTMIVSPDDLVVSPADGLASVGEQGGPFTPACITYTLTNIGEEQIGWVTSPTQPWLKIEPNEGILDANQSVDVNVCIAPEANGLDPNYYQESVAFENTDSGSVKFRSMSLTIKPPDMFTEFFDSGGDLYGYSLTLTPDGSIAYYEACQSRINEFPTDPNGGTYIGLGDDDFAEIILEDGAEVLFFGQWYDRFYIGSNGYITFGSGDTEFDSTLDSHFNMPRISGYFTDLTPPNNQCISYKQFEDRVVVTFEGILIFGDKDAVSSFQIEIFFADGGICMSWLELAEAEAVVGLSKGTGLPPVFFLESDLSGYLPCPPLGDFDRNYVVDLMDLWIFAGRWLDEDCNIPSWCAKTDLDFSGAVQGIDFSIFAQNWGVVEEWWLWPVAHWEFEEGSGGIAYDLAGNNDGTLEGDTSWVQGNIGSHALQFDGNGDYVIGSSSPFDFEDTTFSVAAWFKTTSGEQVIISEGGYQGGWLVGSGWSTYEGQLFVVLKRSGTTSNALVATTEDICDDGEWHHIAAVITTDTSDAQGNHADIYIDGRAVSVTETKTYPYSSSDENWRIGCRPVSPEYFDGSIDDVRIYDRALSAEEIEELYHEGQGYKALSPKPHDGQTGVDPNVVLSWSAGMDAESHDVYFGTSFGDVNDADINDSNVFMGNQDVTYWDTNNYDSNGLEYETTYYWRIDEVNGPNEWKGDVWSFTTWTPFDPNLNLISHWKFDEGSGAIAYDSAGENDGTLVNEPVWTIGKINGALDFSGNDAVNIAPSAGTDSPLNLYNTDMSISVWVKFRGTGGTIVARSKPYYITYRLGINGNQAVINTYKQGPGHWNLSAERELDTDTWYHLVGVFDRDGDVGRVYIDGSKEAEGAMVTDPLSNDATTKIGCRNDTSDYAFDGVIDDVRIYDRALSAEEVEQLYGGGMGE